MQGKPYAGNPHVRFDEGEVAPSATPRRGSLLYKKLHMLMMIGSAVVAVGAVSHAEGGEFCTHFRPNSKNCLYKPGDRAVVEVSFADKAGNSLKSGVVDVWADDGWTNIVWRRKVDLAKELQPVRMELSRSTPGSLRIRAKGCDCPVRAQMDRVLFGVDEINPLTPCPADFEAYWRGEQKRLEREVPIDAEKVLAPELSTADHDVFRVSFATFGGKRIYGLLTVPKGNGEGPFPAVVSVPGAGYGDQRLNREIVRKGWVTLMMNIHCFPLDGTHEEYVGRYWDWFDKFVRAAGEKRYQLVGYAAGPEATLYHGTILGMTRAVEWLSRERYVDSSRVVYYGCSQGGGYGLFLSAMWGKFAKTFVMCPNKCDTCAHLRGRQPGSSHVMTQRPENRKAAERNAPYLDNCNFARMIKTPLRLTVGSADDNCQTVGIIAAYNMISSKDKEMKVVPGKGHGWLKEGYDKWLFDLN